MNKNMLIVAVIVVGVVVVGAMLMQPKHSSTTINPESTKTENQATESTGTKDNTVLSGEVAVTLENFSFNPKNLTVKKGTNVTWTNKDSTKHDVASDTGTELESELLGQGESYSHVFNTAGTYSYHCNPHAAKMKATVEVVE